MSMDFIFSSRRCIIVAVLLGSFELTLQTSNQRPAVFFVFEHAARNNLPRRITEMRAKKNDDGALTDYGSVQTVSLSRD